MRRSNTGPISATFSSAARRDRLWVVGPGTDSARSKAAGSSVWQKYCDRKSSCRQIICAPLAAASRIRHSALARFSLGSSEQAIWMRPTRNLDCFTTPLYRALGMMMSEMHRALVLFDIDGTLVRRAGPHHRAALVQGVRRVTGLNTTTEGIPVQGMLDPDILTAMMCTAGVRRDAIREAMPEVLKAAERYYLRVCPELRDKHCPGVVPVLERLTRRGVLLGLVTGNLTRIGWRKLERAGLRGYFRFGAFGEMAKDRAGLAKLAIREARLRGWIGREAVVSLIGDAPQDIQAARANRIRAISVRTGITPVEELEPLRPDMLLRDLRELRLRMVE